MDKTIVIGVRIGENGNYMKFFYDADTHYFNFDIDNGKLTVWHHRSGETRLIVPESNVLYVEIGENDGL